MKKMRKLKKRKRRKKLNLWRGSQTAALAFDILDAFSTKAIMKRR